MAQPKIQQYQSDIAGGGLASFVSVYRSSDLSVPVSTNTTVTFPSEYFDDDNWYTPNGTDLIIPSGVTKIKIIAFTRFARSSGAAIGNSSTLLLNVKVNSVDKGYGSSIGSNSTDIRSNCVNVLTPWISVSPGQPIRLIAYHTESASPVVIPTAWLIVEGMN